MNESSLRASVSEVAQSKEDLEYQIAGAVADILLDSKFARIIELQKIVINVSNNHHFAEEVEAKVKLDI